MRQRFGRVFDLALGAACALVLVGAAGRAAPHPDPIEAATPIDDPYVLPDGPMTLVPDEPAIALVPPIDPKAAWLAAEIARGRHWRLETARGPIHIWTPAGYARATAQIVLYVHGYHANADTVWDEHRLAEQFALSGANALFVVPEAPTGKHDPIAWPSPSALLREVRRGIEEELPLGRVAAIGHSGAYRTLIPWLQDGRLDTVVLLDAAYVDVLPYRAWVIGSKARRFLNVSIDTVRWSDRLHRTLPSTRTIEGFPREITDDLAKARILYIRSDIGHWPLASEGIALPAMVRALGPTHVYDELPPLGLPPRPDDSRLAQRGEPEP